MPRVRLTRASLILLAALLCPPTAASAQQTPLKSAPYRRTFPVVMSTNGGETPTIDGRVTEPVWQRVPPMTDFTQQDPLEGQPSTERTEVRVLVTATHLYVGIICFDRDPSSIIVTPTRRDSSLADTDSVVLVFDTFNDNQNAYVFGTSPAGAEYDGQVAREGQTSGVLNVGTTSLAASVATGNIRGTVSGFNANWDGDWVVRAQVTDRGWEAEMAIPLTTLRYASGTGQTWGFNVLRNIRHKNEQAYLAPIARGFDIYRVSDAAKITGLTLPSRRELKVIPYVLAGAEQDLTHAGTPADGRAAAGADLKWGVREGLTLDATVNTDFAQVETDDQQLNLTRFDLFFPEKRPFFLENASTFQFGQPQAIDLFFSRRIGLTATGAPIDIIAGTRLSGRLFNGWNVGLLDVETARTDDAAGKRIAPATNFSVFRAQKEVGRSTVGAIFVGRKTTDDDPTGSATTWNRAYGIDADVSLSRSQRLSTFFARSDTPGATGSDYTGRVFYTFTNTIWTVNTGLTHVGDRFNPEVGFLPRKGYRRPDLRITYGYQPKSIPWIRRVSPHMTTYAYYGLDGQLQSSTAHLHMFEIQPARGGRFGFFMDRNDDRPTKPFTVYDRDGRKVVIPPGFYTWWQKAVEYLHNPSAAVTVNARFRFGRYYDGGFTQLEFTSDYRISTRFAATIGWTRQHAELPGGTFTTHLVPLKLNYAFTPHVSLSALVQYNGQTAQVSSNVRLALLTRSGTGLFVVYNDRHNTTPYPSTDPPGRSLVVKFTRLFDL